MDPEWRETDTDLYRQIAPVAVPARAEQIAALLTLLPFRPDEPFRVVELGCGEGRLAAALLSCFAGAEILALDGSAGMRAQAAARLGQRAEVAPFQLAAAGWRGRLAGADCVLASLSVHHLDGAAKQRLFADIHAGLSTRGVLLLADLVAPQRAEAGRLFAATWDRLAEQQSLAETGSRRRFEQFVAAEWNFYRFPDPVDRPSSLFDQLRWLRESGFAVVDCFWMQAGHAIYGGYKEAASPPGESLSFERALQAARTACNA